MMTTPHEAFYRKHRRPRPGHTLIVGSHVYPGREDRRKLYPDALGVDMLDGPGVDRVLDLESTASAWQLFNEGFLFNHVECRSVLEHSRKPWLLAENLERLMAPHATLDLAVPFVWRVHAYPNDYWRFTIEAIRELFPRIEWDALMYASETTLTKSGKGLASKVNGRVHFARCEVLGFGVKR